MSVINDPKAVRRQYATDEHIRVRQEIHGKYTVPKVDFVEWALHTLRWQGGETVLDVGCGNGSYYYPLQYLGASEETKAPAAIRYYGLDLSDGMLVNHPGNGSGILLQADAQSLPFPDHYFDVVMANHMMYHVPDLDRAIKEFRRVLKPSGVLMSTTNSQQSMPELQVLMRRAIILLSRSTTSQIQAPMPASDLFALENGARYLRRHFYAVMRHDLPSALRFTEIEPVMAYLESTREMREPQLPTDVAWDDVMAIMRQQVTHLINHLGELPIAKQSGVLIATDNGDFIRKFIETREKIIAK